MNKTTALGGVFAALVLSACGGGGDDVVAPPAKPPATVVTGVEGLWTGATTDPLNVQGVVLENGESWSILTDTVGTVVGMSLGTVQTAGPDVVSGSGRFLNVVDEANVANRKTEPVSYTGKYAVRDSVQVTASNGVKFSGTYGVLYEQPAVVSELLGNFTGTGIGNQVREPLISVAITTGGLVSIPSYPGCSVRGTVVPRASGRNVFDLPLTFSGTSCPVGDGVVIQNVVLYNDTTQAIVIMGQSASKAQTFFYTGQKT
ncbi:MULTISPECIES: hypothetical protein [unclassified Acidovorax]|uniref:hypothetical protein n=1 Tax=unclassified Acidovorax TaxID=2684926 RepID=UPI000AD6DCB4|nr:MULTISPECIES: hypothetical protein [unclassified Acidovorax]MBD9391598.1 hypothetical protein [Acidovorax sp. ACV01]